MATAAPPSPPRTRQSWILTSAIVAVVALAGIGVGWYVTRPDSTSAPNPIYEMQSLSVTLMGTGAANSSVTTAFAGYALCGPLCPSNFSVGSKWQVSFQVGETILVAKGAQYSVTSVSEAHAGAFVITNVTMFVNAADSGPLPIAYPDCNADGCGGGGTVYVRGTTVALGQTVQTLELGVEVEKLF